MLRGLQDTMHTRYLVCFKQQGLLWSLLLGRWETCSEVEVAICRLLANVHLRASFLRPVLLEKLQIKIEISGFLGKTRSCHPSKPTLLQGGLDPPVSQDLCLSPLLCHTHQQQLSSCTQSTYSCNLTGPSRYWGLWLLALPRKNKTHRHEI